MKKTVLTFMAMLVAVAATAQLKPRPDAFPPVDEDNATKALTMATTPAQMASWDRYPTYSTYVTMMQQWATDFPTLCRLDTIGTSVNGRLILSLELTANPTDTTLPQFFYSSTIHGDELTGFVLMMHLIDTLLNGYGHNPQYTALMNTTLICINPLANPDGTYYGGDNTVQNSRRYNANNVDLNRNYPNPFGSSKAVLQPENAAMIAYFDRHRFRLSANLHGGSEVLNYPWDSFTSAQNPHPKSAWWIDVCQRFMDTLRTYNTSHFTDVTSSGYIAGGDWYVITGGRQDYFNYYYNCLEMTMEVSTTKKLSTTQLPTYWNFLQHPLVNYIAEIHGLYSYVSATPSDSTHGTVTGSGYYENDSVAILTATPADSCLFLRWSNGSADNPLQITVTTDTSLVAIFAREEATTYTVTALSADTTMGYVEGGGTYLEESTATLTAHSLEGYLFSHWMDGDTANPRFVTVTSDTVFTAFFVADSSGNVGIAPNQLAATADIRVINGCITATSSQWPLKVYDTMGREVDPCVPRTGVYLVKAGDNAVCKLLVIKE